MTSDANAVARDFDAFAVDYDRTRPVCPAALFDDLLVLAALSLGDRVLEIGCGSGQATVPLAERGLAVTALDLGTNLTAIARRHVARFPDVTVITSSFEDWAADQRRFAAVVVFNALHWIAPEVRYAKPAALLEPGGMMLVGACHWALPEDAEPFWHEVEEDYRAVSYEGAPPPPPEAIDAWHFPAEADVSFAEVAARRYPFQTSYSAEAYLAMLAMLATLATQSGTRLLGEERQAEFLAHVRARLRPWPRLTATFVGFLTAGRRRAAPSPSS